MQNLYKEALLYSLASKLPGFGRIFVVLNSSDTGNPYYDVITQLMQVDDMGAVRVFTSLAEAYAETTSNNDDVILLSGHSTHLLDSCLTVAKNRVHFVSLDTGRLTGQAAKIELSTAGKTADTPATIKNTGTRNSFIGLKVMNSGTHANSIAAFIDEGEATYIERVSSMKFTDLDQATVADFICRADSATYVDVEFGFDTLVQSAARPTLWFKNDGATRAKNVRIIRPKFVCASSEATKPFIKIENTSSLAFNNIIESPTFINAIVGSLSAAALNDAITSASGLDEGVLFVTNPKSNTTEFCSAVTDGVKVTGPAVSQQAGEAVSPA